MYDTTNIIIHYICIIYITRVIGFSKYVQNAMDAAGIDVNYYIAYLCSFCRHPFCRVYVYDCVRASCAAFSSPIREKSSPQRTFTVVIFSRGGRKKIIDLDPGDFPPLRQTMSNHALILYEYTYIIYKIILYYIRCSYSLTNRFTKNQTIYFRRNMGSFGIFFFSFFTAES